MGVIFVTKLRVAGIGVAAVAALSLTACSGSDTASSGSSSSSMAPSSSVPAPSSSMASGAANGVTTNADVFGPACSQLPQGSSPGSLDSMGPQPVASAASTNPLLTKLVAAVKATNLVDTLNTAGGPVKIEGSGDTMTINGAKVLCGNIPTKNATVFVIDKVLTPGTNQ